jgi:predicted enzyme related to lactoylglutathione lyase
MAAIERIGNVFYRVSDMDAAVEFYGQTLGLTQKFRDGDNWAAFDVGGVTLALEGASGPIPAGGGATVSLRVEGLDDLVASLRAAGARVGAVVAGGHERRASLTDPSGNTLVLYEPMRR